MTPNPNIFRKYDIRGIADRDLTDETVYLIGRAFASFMIKQTGVKNPTVVVGRDIRPSSPRMKNAMAKALIDSGVNVIDIGIVTTPVTYFSIVNLNTTGGVMITGSHNPADQNGIKPCIGRASVYGDDIQKLRQMIDAKDFVDVKGTETLKEMIADVGLAFDGDADRIGVIDNEGNIIWGDKLLILYSRFILEQKPGAKFIADVKCSRSFFEDVEKHGGKAIMWKTGHALIKQKLKDEQADLAGEMSGHMFFVNRYYGFDDAVYAGLRVLEILDRKNKKLTDLLSDIPKTFATPEIRFHSTDEKKFAIVDRVAEYFSKLYPTLTIDGARIDFGDGWGLIRSSNTEPVLVMRFEASTEKRLQEIKSIVEQKAEEFSK